MFYLVGGYGKLSGFAGGSVLLHLVFEVSLLALSWIVMGLTAWADIGYGEDAGIMLASKHPSLLKYNVLTLM